MAGKAARLKGAHAVVVAPALRRTRTQRLLAATAARGVAAGLAPARILVMPDSSLTRWLQLVRVMLLMQDSMAIIGVVAPLGREAAARALMTLIMAEMIEGEAIRGATSALWAVAIRVPEARDAMAVLPMNEAILSDDRAATDVMVTKETAKAIGSR